MNRIVSPATRTLIRLNMIMRRFRESNNHILYVADRLGNRHDVVVLIVDILDGEKERAEEVVKRILNHLDSYNIKVVDYKLDSYLVPWREVWRFVAVVAVDNSQ